MVLIEAEVYDECGEAYYTIKAMGISNKCEKTSFVKSLLRPRSGTYARFLDSPARRAILQHATAATAHFLSIGNGVSNGLDSPAC